MTHPCFLHTSFLRLLACHPRLRVDSYYVASVFGVVFDCVHNTKGMIHTLQMPEARNWTNYSVEFRAYSDYTMFGVVFRYQVWIAARCSMLLHCCGAL
jgi:hypothetical protein